MAATLGTAVHANSTGATITFPLTLTSGQGVYALLMIRDAGGYVYASSTWNGSSAPASQNGAGTVQGGLLAVDAAWLPAAVSATTANLVITLGGTHTNVDGVAWPINSPHATTIMGTSDQYDVTDSVASPATVTNSMTTDDVYVVGFRVRQDLTASLAAQAGQTTEYGDALEAGTGNTLIYTKETGAASVTSGFTFDDSGFPTYMTFGRVVQGAAAGGGLSKVIASHHYRTTL